MCSSDLLRSALHAIQLSTGLVRDLAPVHVAVIVLPDPVSVDRILQKEGKVRKEVQLLVLEVRADEKCAL